MRFTLTRAGLACAVSRAVAHAAAIKESTFKDACEQVEGLAKILRVDAVLDDLLTTLVGRAVTRNPPDFSTFLADFESTWERYTELAQIEARTQDADTP